MVPGDDRPAWGVAMTWPDAMVTVDGVVVAKPNGPAAWCDGCSAWCTFSILPDSVAEGRGLDPTWTYWSCDECGGVPPVCPWVFCGCGGIIDCHTTGPTAA